MPNCSAPEPQVVVAVLCSHAPKRVEATALGYLKPLDYLSKVPAAAVAALAKSSIFSTTCAGPRAGLLSCNPRSEPLLVTWLYPELAIRSSRARWSAPLIIATAGRTNRPSDCSASAERSARQRMAGERIGCALTARKTASEDESVRARKHHRVQPGKRSKATRFRSSPAARGSWAQALCHCPGLPSATACVCEKYGIRHDLHRQLPLFGETARASPRGSSYRGSWPSRSPRGEDPEGLGSRHADGPRERRSLTLADGCAVVEEATKIPAK